MECVRGGAAVDGMGGVGDEVIFSGSLLCMMNVQV